VGSVVEAVRALHYAAKKGAVSGAHGSWTVWQPHEDCKPRAAATAEARGHSALGRAVGSRVSDWALRMSHRG